MLYLAIIALLESAVTGLRLSVVCRQYGMYCG